MHYLARWRLQVSAQRLSTSHYSAARIAYEVGYESEAAFNRAFKRLFGAPPAMWRKRCEDPGDETARTVGGLGLRGKSLRSGRSVCLEDWGVNPSAPLKVVSKTDVYETTG